MSIRKFLSRLLVSACILGTVTYTAQAQDQQGGGRQGRGGGPGGPGGGGRGMMGMGMMGGGGLASLLLIKEVREELKMDEEQVKEVTALGESLRSGRQGGGGGGGFQPGQRPDPAAMAEMMEKMQKAAEEAETKLEEILDPKQIDRLMGLFAQRAGTRAISSKLIATKIGVTDEQKTKLAEIDKENGAKMQEVFSGGNFDRDKMREIGEQAEAKRKAVFTETQLADLEKLKGEKFEFPQMQFGGPGGPGGGGRPGRGNRPGNEN